MTTCDLRFPVLADFAHGSVAWAIQRYIEEMNGEHGKKAVRPLGQTQMYGLRGLQRPRLGTFQAAELGKRHIIEHCRERRATVSAATVCQDISYLAGALKYAGSAWDDCEDISAAPIVAAWPFLADAMDALSDEWVFAHLPTDERDSLLYLTDGGEREVVIMPMRL